MCRRTKQSDTLGLLADVLQVRLDVLLLVLVESAAVLADVLEGVGRVESALVEDVVHRVVYRQDNP